ncbi:hypothetical protein DAQ1742_00788 [Dickeya aquatica]|uniref:Uncharacterized protein n=1 Tax=Dickeya aquatica TaxID=1401087 RepID=A0A375A755_9GAMM|nr:hypothetical protein DAQ1742_00788 [Dickeya aquatica]
MRCWGFVVSGCEEARLSDGLLPGWFFSDEECDPARCKNQVKLPLIY